MSTEHSQDSWPTYHPINWYQLHIDLLRHDAEILWLRQVLSDIARNIEKCELRMRALGDDPDPDYAEILAEEEGRVQQSLLGLSLVACQVYISNVTSRVQGLVKYIRKHSQGDLGITRKPDVLKLRNAKISQTNFSQVEILNALANCFKHRDDWPLEWDASGESADTVKILRAIGLSPSSQILSHGLRAIGFNHNNELPSLAEVLSHWRQDVAGELENRLKSKGLIE